MHPVHGLADLHRVSHGTQSTLVRQLMLVAQPLQVLHMVLIVGCQLFSHSRPVRSETYLLHHIIPPFVKFPQIYHPQEKQYLGYLCL